MRRPNTMTQAREAALVLQVRGVLNLHTASPWEFEAFCIHTVRVKLVWELWRWAEAHAKAGAIVKRALRENGRSERPSWAEGQPDWTEPVRMGKQVRALARATSPDYFHHRVSPLLARVKTCPECGTPFATETTRGDQTFCSLACATRARAASGRQPRKPRTIEDKTCPTCKTIFRPRLAKNVYCSTRCSELAQSATRRVLPDIQCASCGTLFRPKTKATKFCSAACVAEAHRAKMADTRRPERACEMCGATFRPDKEERTTCSRTCGSKLAWETRRRANKTEQAQT